MIITQEICKNTISSWLKKTILLAYEHSSEETNRIYNVKAHEVRAMASSLAFLSNVAMEDLLTACTWKNHSTFTSFYLRDLTMIKGDLLSLGPLVVAQHST